MNSILTIFLLAVPTQETKTTMVSLRSDGSQGATVAASRNNISANARFVTFVGQGLDPTRETNCCVQSVYVHDLITRKTLNVSVTSQATQNGNWHSYNPSISGDGTLVAFHSHATNLVPDDTNQDYPGWDGEDIFVHDLLTQTTIRANLDENGNQSNFRSRAENPWISSNGRFVAFESTSNNLISGDTNGKLDIYVKDLQTSDIERVSVASDGTEATNNSFQASLSADGRYAVFSSRATNLAPGKSTSFTDVFLHDRQTQKTSIISTVLGSEGDGDSSAPAIAADGRLVVFESEATNMVPADTNGCWDVFLHDRSTNTTRRISVSEQGAEGNRESRFPSISDDGRYVSFQSAASNLISGDTNGSSDFFRYEIGSGRLERMSVTTGGGEIPTGTGSRYANGSSRHLTRTGGHATWISKDSFDPADNNFDIDTFVSGTYLTLDLQPLVAFPGDQLTLTNFQGAFGDPAFLFVTALDGKPLTLYLSRGRFDPTGYWIVSFLIPNDPIFSGFTLEFKSFGLLQGTLRQSNTAVVRFG